MAFISASTLKVAVGRNRSAFTSDAFPSTRHVTITRVPFRRCRTPRMEGGPARIKVADTPRKVFLDRLKPLGNVRIVARNNAAIMEAIATFDGLFFATIRSGKYANIIDMSINLDMHLLLTEVAGARFEIGVSRSVSKAPTYIIRILGKDKTPVLSIFMHWDKDPSDIEPERIEAWKKMKADYLSGDDDTFFFED